MHFSLLYYLLLMREKEQPEWRIDSVLNVFPKSSYAEGYSEI